MRNLKLSRVEFCNTSIMVAEAIIDLNLHHSGVKGANMIFCIFAIFLAVTTYAQQGGTITNCYAIGNVSGPDYIGGINGSGGNVESSYFVGGVEIDSNVGGISGANAIATNSFYNSDLVTADNQIGTPASTEQMKDSNTYTSWDFDNTWTIFSNVNDGYPFFLEQIPNMQDADITLATTHVYKGDSIKPSPIVIYRGGTLVENIHYTLSYSNYFSAGTATITVTGIGGYFGLQSINFTIHKATGTCEVSMTNYTAGQNKPSPKPHSDSNGEDNVSYIYTGNGHNSSDPPANASETEYKITAIFAPTDNYDTCKAYNTFYIHAAGDPIQVPTGKTLLYTGDTLTGVDFSTGYDIIGNKAVNAGDYVATLTLTGGNFWQDDNSQNSRTIEWSIQKATRAFKDTSIAAKYTDTLTLKDISLSGNYEWKNEETSLTKLGDSSYAAIYTDPSGNYEPVNGNIKVKVIEGDGTGYVYIPDWTYEQKASEPQYHSPTNTDEPKIEYEGTNHPKSTTQPTNAGDYKIIATFPASSFYNTFITDSAFTIRKAPGSGTAKMANWYEGETPPMPEATSETNDDSTGVTYRYWDKAEGEIAAQTTRPANPGEYIVEATFPANNNYESHKDTITFYIWQVNNVQITWTPACGHEYTYNGKEQSPTPSAAGYNLSDFVLAGAGTDADSYTMTAELKTPDNGVNLQNTACPYTIAKKTLQVEWTADSVFTYNKMDQSPRASLAVPEHGVEFEYTNRKSSVGKYEGGDGVRVDIMDKSIADNYILANRIKNYEILKKDLTPYFAAVYPDDFPPNADTLWVSHEVFADSTLLLEVLEDLIDYDGFATDTVKKETDDATVLKGKAKVKIKYDDDEDGNSQGNKSFLAKRVETTQKATATIITDGVSADNYTPLVRPTAIVILATVVEDDNAPQIYCKRNSKYAEIGRNTCGAIGGEIFEELFCVIDATCTQITASFSLNACTSLDGEPVPTCNETPIPHTPNPIPYTPVTPHYYTLKGTSLGTTKPTAPGIYIAKIGKQTLKIMVK